MPSFFASYSYVISTKKISWVNESFSQAKQGKPSSSTKADSTHSSSRRSWKAPEDSIDGSPAKSFWRRFNELLMYLSIQHKASWPRLSRSQGRSKEEADRAPKRPTGIGVQRWPDIKKQDLRHDVCRRSVGYRNVRKDGVT